MNLKEVNDLLRSVLVDLINNSWPKSSIGKLLFGPNGQSQLNYWLTLEDNVFVKGIGFKPISKIASQLGYQAHIVFVRDDEPRKVVESIQEKNTIFANELKQKLEERLTDESKSPKILRTPRGSKIDKLLDIILLGQTAATEGSDETPETAEE